MESIKMNWKNDGIHELLEDWFVHIEDPQDMSFKMEKKRPS